MLVVFTMRHPAHMLLAAAAVAVVIAAASAELGAAAPAQAVSFSWLELTATYAEFREDPAKLWAAVARFKADPRDFVLPYKDSILAAGNFGLVCVFGVYFVSTVFMLPLWGFHVVVGFVYGPWLSVLFITSTQALCSGAAFSASRHLVRPCVKRRMEEKYGRKYTAIDEALSKNGLFITTLLRLSPLIPFGVNNYLCGCTKMKLWHFVVGTFFGVLPGNFVYCRIAAMGDDQSLGMALKGVVACAMLGVLYFVNKMATDALREAGIGQEDEKTE